MKKITAIIVEDSRLARLELKELLKKYKPINLIGEAENVSSAYELIQKNLPDLLFLDINMPEKNGFELLEKLDKLPLVIFTTAYDEYAIKSFEYNAFDYLLKPIHQERFDKTISKVTSFFDDKQHTETKTVTEKDQIFIKEGENCWMVKLQDIFLFEIVGNYTRVYFDNNKPMIYKSLNQVESKLPSEVFFRVNRQQLINIKKITKVTPWFSGKLKIELNSSIEVETSRRQALKFRQNLEF